jgi:NADH dehydrogenase
MKKILLLGGTGFVGRNVCEKLVRQQWRVTVPTRRDANGKSVKTLPMVDVLEANIHDEAALMRLVAGHDAVVNLVAILHGTQSKFERTHVELVRKLASACRASGVQRVVHVSALGAAPDAPSMYQRSKAAGEAVLAASGLNVTVLRPSVIFGADDQFLNLFARLQGIFPVMPLAGADTRFQPVWVEDVADAILRCLQMDSTPAPVYEGFGPETFTLRQLVQLSGRLSGHPRPVIGLPMALGRLQALAMELAPGEPLMSRDNLDSMQVDNVASGKLPGLDALGIQTSALSAIAPTYLGNQGPRTGLLGLRRTSGR